VAAIANYTVQVVDTTLSADDRQTALKFIDHFLGDISQPLHVEAIALGGNDIDVICAGKSTNLHAIWDTNMLDLNLDANFGGSVQTYADSLVARIQYGDFAAVKADWLACSSTTEPFTDVSKRSGNHTIARDIANLLSKRDIVPLACPLVWAREANAFDCSYVFGFESLPAGSDICATDYFTNAVPIIDLQLARSGLRLAAWLNVLFDGATYLP